MKKTNVRENLNYSQEEIPQVSNLSGYHPGYANDLSFLQTSDIRSNY